MNPSHEKQLEEIRLLGVEDGSFCAFGRGEKKSTILCCVEMTKDLINFVRILPIKIDGFDATEKLLKMVSGDCKGVDAIILGGITFAGFNIINPITIYRDTGVSVIIYSGKRPNQRATLIALRKHFDDWLERWKIIKDLGVIYETFSRPGEPPIYFEVIGRSKIWAETILKHSAMVCRIPEPVRVAGIIARGVS